MTYLSGRQALARMTDGPNRSVRKPTLKSTTEPGIRISQKQRFLGLESVLSANGGAAAPLCPPRATIRIGPAQCGQASGLTSRSGRSDAAQRRVAPVGAGVHAPRPWNATPTGDRNGGCHRRNCR